jgi:hypothetical protein
MKISNIASIVKYLYILCILLSIQSCGGEQPSDIDTNLKISTIQTEPFLYEETEISVTASILALNSNAIDYQWRQVSGIPITLEKNDQKTIIFTAPDITANEKIKLELTVQDSIGNTDIKEIELTLLHVPSPIVIEIEKNITVNELSEVTITANILVEESNITYLWQQKSGPNVEITSQIDAEISFHAPKVSAIETLSFELTVTDSNNVSSKETTSVTVLPHVVDIPEHVLLLTNKRIGEVKRKIAEDSTAWTVLTNKLNNYFVQIPYNAGEYAGSFALAFYVSGETKYMQRTIELLEHSYFSVPDIGWQSYNSRNAFRGGARWAIMGYTWIKSYIPENKKTEIENILALWSEYWLDHVDFQNDFKSFRIGDTDNLTSLAENITLLGYALSESSQHANLSQKLLSAGDTLINRYVVDYYMKDIMAGGAWAEGSDYSPNTQRHWIRTFMINKDQRDIPYPTNYAHETLQALIHQTLTTYSGVYKYGSEEAATDYDSLSGDYRYEFALELMGILTDEKDLAQLYQWFNTLLEREGFKSSSIITHFERLLYHNPLFNSDLEPYPEKTINTAAGIGLISSRSGWSAESSNLFFINRKVRVDHEHQDALSFDIAAQGKWISKETTGYAGASVTSSAHNTILIENASSDGSSNPTSRPAGDPSFYSVYDDDDITIISAEAANTYNMIGYFATDYAKKVNRQLAFIKPSTIIVYDHIVTDKSQIRDLKQYSPLDLVAKQEHIRWVKIIQHVQALPTPIENHLNSYQVVSEGTKLAYQVHWPLDAKVNIIDEATLWANALDYEIPENQKKWHFEVSKPVADENNEFITSLNFGGNIEDTEYAIAPIIMTKENGLILNGDIMGVALQVQDNQFIILFNQAPELPITSVDYIKPQGFGSAKVYGVGFEVNN